MNFQRHIDEWLVNHTPLLARLSMVPHNKKFCAVHSTPYNSNDHLGSVQEHAKQVELYLYRQLADIASKINKENLPQAVQNHDGKTNVLIMPKSWESIIPMHSIEAGATNETTALEVYEPDNGGAFCITLCPFLEDHAYFLNSANIRLRVCNNIATLIQTEKGQVLSSHCELEVVQ